MRNLKKVLSVLLVVVIMATAMVPAFAADTYTYSTQAKALYDVGLFKGVSTTDYVPDLGSALTREQGIAIVVRLLGKADAAAALSAADADAALAAFGDAKDVEPTLKNSVAYAIKNNLVLGTDAKLIDPKGAMLGKDLAAIILRNLGYTVDAAGYDVATATLADKGGLTTAEATKFATKELIRDDLVGIAYGSLSAKYSDGKTTVIAKLIADKVVDQAKAIAAGIITAPVASAATATVTGAKQFTVAFNTAVDASKVVVTVNKGTIAYNVATVAAGTDNKSVVVTMASKLSAGDYTLSIAGVTDTALTAKVTAADEKVANITFNSTTAAISRDSKSITVGYKVLNQYNEDVTSTYPVTVTVSRGTYSTSGSTITITDNTTNFVVNDKVALQALYVANGTFASTVVTAAYKAQVSDVTINGLVLNSSNQALDTAKTASDYKLDVTLKDQYGNTVTDTTYLSSDVTVTVSAPQYVTVAGGTATSGVVAAPGFTYDSTAKKMYLPLAVAPAGLLTAGTSTVTIISNTTGKIATFDVVVKSSGKVDTLTLSAPDLAVAGEKVNIPFTAVDVYGNAMTSASALNVGAGMTSLSSSVGPISFVQDYVANTANLVLDLTGVQTAQTVVITGITSTSKLVQLTVNVQAPRKPVLVSGTASFTPNFATGATASFTKDNVVVKDQYGRTITTVRNFVAGTDDSIYSTYRLAATSGSTSYVTVTGGTYIDTTTTTLTFNGIAKGSSAVTLKLQTAAGADVSGSEYTFTAKTVDKTDIASYELADIPTLYAVADATYKKAITVNGVLADGSKVVVPASYYTVTAPQLNKSVAGYVYADGTYTFTNSVATVPVIVTVNASGATVLTKNVTVSNVTPTPTTLTLVTNASATVVGTNVISTAASNFNTTIVSGVDTALATLVADAVKNVNQYGVENTTDLGTYTIIATNLASGKSIAGYNGATTTVLAAGDTFNVTAITSNGIVVTFKVILK